MKYGVVIHGPEVIDSGIARELLEWLKDHGEVRATLGGAMGLAALLDAGMEDMVTIVPRQLVSDALVAMDQSSDAVVLLNHGKLTESGIAFGGMVVERCRARLTKPLVQIDNGYFIRWIQGNLGELDAWIKKKGLKEVSPPPLRGGTSDTRIIHGVVPGENIWINGTVIGRATSPHVTIRLIDGELHFENVDVKSHGLEKVKIMDLRKAVIRSGSVRRTRSSALTPSPQQGDRIILVDHRAEDSIFRAKGARAAVTVGDDTTRVAMSLLARLGVPVIGIVDGDEDGICLDHVAASGSASIVLRPGNDDQLGERVREEVFNGKDEVSWDGTLDSLMKKIAAMAGDKLLEIIKK